MKGKVDALANYLRGDDKKKLSPTSMPKLENSCWKCDYPEVNTASLTVSTSSTTSAKVPILKRGSECAVEKKLRCCVILKTTTPAGRPITGASHSASSTAVINPSQVEYKISKQGIIITPRLTTESCSPSEVEAVDGNGNSDLTTCTPSCSGCSQIPLGAGVIHPNLVPHKTLLKSDPEDIEGPPITTPPPEKSCPKKPNPQASQEICPTAQIEGLGLVTAGDKMSLECVRTGKGNRWDYESCKCVTDPSPEEPPTATCVLYESKEIEVKETQVEPSQKPSTNIIAQSIQEINSAPTTQSSSKIGSDGKPLTGITGLAVSIEQLQESKEPVQRINNVDGTLTLVYSDKSQKVITFYPVKDETGAISSESFISRTISPDGKSTKREKLIGNKIKETYFDGTSIIYETLPDDTTRTLSYSDPSNNYIENYEYLEDNTRRVTNNLGGGYKLQKEYTDQEGKTTFRNLEELDKFGRTFKYQYITKEINGKSREITIILDKNNEVIDSSYKEGFKPFSLVCNQENKDYKCTPPEPEQYEAKQNEDSSITYTKKEGEPYWYKCKQMYVKDPSNVFGGQKKTCVMLESQGKFDEKTNTFDTQLYEYDSKTGTTKTTSKNNPNDITITNQVLNEDGTVESLTLMATTDSGQRYYPKKQSDGTILHEFEDGTKQLLSNKGEITAFWSDTGEKTEVLGKNSAGQTEYKVLSKDGSTTYYKEDGKNADGTTHYFTTKTINKNGEEIIREKTSQGFKEITYVEKEGKKVKRETQYTYDEKGNAAPQNYKDEDGQTGDFVGGQQKEITQKCGDKKEDDCVYEWFENDYQLKKIEKSDGSYESYTYTTYQGVPLTRVQRIDGTYFVLLEAENKKQETIEFFDGENHICTAKLKDNTYVQSILSNKKTSLSQYVYLNQETNKKLASLGMNQDSNQFTLRFKNEKGETFKQTPLENGYLKLEPDDSFNFFNKEIYAHPAYYSYLKENCYAEPKQEEKIIQENLQAYQEYLKPEKPQQETSGDVQCVSNAINKAGQGKAKLPEPKLVYQITDPKNNNRVVREAMLEEVDGEQAIYDYVYKEENQYLRINVKEKSWVKYEQNKPTSQLMKLQTSNQLTGEQTVHTSEKFDYQLATFSNEDSQVFKCKEYKTEDYKQPLASEIETPSSTECETNPELCTPSKCPDENSQVCGRDGKTYKNNCELKLAGAKISYEGACETICQTNEDCNSQSVCADGTQYYPKICIEKSREIENEDSTTEEVKYKTCAVNPQAATICLRAKCPPVSASNTCPQDTLSKETFNNNGCFTGYQCINANGGITPPIQRTCPTLEAPTPPVGYKATPILDTNNCVVSYNIRPPEYQPKEEKPNLEKPAGEINCDQVSVCNDGRVIKPYIKSGSQCILNPAEKCEESLLTYNSEVVDYIDEDKDGRVDIDSDNVEDSALIKKVSETRAEVVRIPFGSKDNDHDNDAIPDWLDIDKYNTGVMFTKPAYSTQEAPEDRDQDNNNDVMEMLLAGPLYAQGKGYNFENDQLNNLVSDKERTSFSSIKHALTSYAELIPGYLILKLPYTLMSNLRWSAPSVTGLVFFPAGPDSAFPSPIVEELKSEKKDKPLGYVDYLNKAYFNANKIIANNDQLRDYVDNHLNPILAKLASVNDKLKACQNFDVNKLKAEIEENAKKISTDAQTIIDDSNLETESVRDFLNSKVEVAWMALNGYDYWQNYVDNLKNAGQNYKNAKQNLQNTEKVKSSAEDAARQATQKLRDQLEDYLSKMPPERAEKAREAVTQFLDEFSGLVEDFAADPQNPERGGQYRSDLRKVQGASQKAQNQLDIFRRTSYESLLKEYGTPEAVDQARQQLLGNLDNARDIEKQLKNAAGTISRINLDGLQSKLGTLPPESKDVIGSVLNDYGKVMDSYWSAYGQESQLRNLYQTWFGEIESPPINYPTDINSLKNQQGEQFNNFAAQDILRGVLKGEISLDSGIIQTDQNGQALDITQKVMDKIKSGEKLSEEETSLLQKEVRNKVESQEKKLLDSYEDYRAQNKKEIMKQREKDLEKMKQERKEKLEQEILDAQIKAEKVKTWDWEAETEGLYGLIDVLEIKLDGVKDKRNEYLKLAQKIIMQIQKMGGDFGKAKLLYGLLSIEATKIRNEGQQMTKFIKDKKGDLAPSNLSPEERAQKYTLETYQKIKEQLQKYEDELKLASKKGEKDNLEAMIKLQKELLKKVYFQLAHNYLVARTYYHKAYIDLTTMQSITASMFLLKSFSCQLDAQLQGTHLTQPQEGAALPLVGYAINSCLTGPLASSLTGMQTADIEQQKNIPEQQASPCKVCTGIDGTPAYSEESLFSQDYKAVASATGMQVKIPSTRVEPLTPSSRTDHSITQEPRTAQNIGSTSGAPPSIPTTTVKAEIPAEKEAPISVEKIAAAKVLCPGKENERLASVNGELRAVEACQPAEIQGLTIPQEQLGQAAQNMNSCWNEYNEKYSSDAFDKFRNEQLAGLNEALLQAGLPIKATDWSDLNKPVFATAIGDQLIKIEEGKLVTQTGDTGVKIDQALNALQSFTDEKFTKPSSAKQDQCDQKSVEYTDVIQKAAKEAGYSSVQVSGSKEKPSVFAKTTDGKDVYFTEKGIPVIAGGKVSSDYAVLKDGTKAPIGLEQNGIVYDVQDGVLVKCAVVPNKDYEQYSAADKACLSKAYLENIKRQLIAAGKLEEASNIAAQQGLLTSQELASRAGELQKEAKKLEDKVKEALGDTKEKLTNILLRDDLQKLLDQAKSLREQASQLTEQALNAITDSLQETLDLKKIDFKVNLGNIKEALSLVGIKEYDEEFKKDSRYAAFKGILNPLLVSKSQNDLSIIGQKLESDSIQLQKDIENLQNPFYYRDRAREAKQLLETLTKRMLGEGTLEQQLLGMGYNSEDIEKVMTGFKQIISGYASLSSLSYNYKFGRLADYHRDLTEAMIEYDGERKHLESLQTEFASFMNVKLSKDSKETVAEELAHRINDINDRSKTRGDQSQSLTDLKKLFDPLHSSEERYAEGVLTYKSETYDLSQEQRNTLTQQINPTVEKIKRIREKIDRKEKLGSEDYISPEESNLVLLAAGMLGKGKDTHYVGLDGQNIKDADYGDFLKDIIQRKDLATALSYVISQTAMMEGEAQSRGDVDGANSWSSKRKQAEELAEYNGAVLNVLNAEDELSIYSKEQQEARITSLGRATHNANLAMLTMGQSDEDKTQTRVNYFNRLTTEWINAESAEAEQRKARGGLAWGFATSITDMLTGNMPGSTVKEHSRAATKEHNNRLIAQGGLSAVNDELATNDPDAYREQIVPTLLANAQSLVNFAGRAKSFGFDDASDLEQSSTAYSNSILQIMTRGTQISAESTTRRAISEDPSILTRRFGQEILDPKNKDQKELYIKLLVAESVNKAVKDYTSFVSNTFSGLDENSATGGMAHDLMKGLSIESGELAHKQLSDLGKTDPSKLSGQALQIYNNAKASAINTLANTLDFKGKNYNAFLSDYSAQESNFGTLLMKVGNYFYFGDSNYATKDVEKERDTAYKQADLLRSLAKGDSLTEKQHIELVKLGFDSKSTDWGLTNKDYGEFRQSTINDLSKIPIGMTGIKDVEQSWAAKMLSPREVGTQVASFFVGGLFAKAAVEGFQALRMGSEAVQAARFADTANRAAQIAGEAAQAARTAQQASRLSKVMWGLADFGVEASAFELGMGIGSAAVGDTSQLKRLVEHPVEGFVNSAGMLGTFKVAGMAFGKPAQELSSSFSKAAEEGTFGTRIAEQAKSMEGKLFNPSKPFFNAANNIATGVQLIGEIGTMMASSRAEEWYSGQESKGLLYNLAQATYQTAMMRGVAGLQHRGEGDLNSRMEADAKKTTRDYLESQARMRELLEAGEVIGKAERQL
ncbi:hypothetical protein HZA99_01735, partial [Candidatus Woesearchaeota archaeon]|nr:hypothetical protein [Candidatus Woesearchaeota archaeon]